MIIDNIRCIGNNEIIGLLILLVYCNIRLDW